MTILQATMSDGTLVPVQADSQGRLVAEGLQGPEGPQGPQGPPGVGQLPPNPQNGDVLAWDNGLVWVSGIIPAPPPETDVITGVSIQGGGTPTTTLVFASDRDLSLFKPLDTVQQNSGYTPQTSAITGVAADTPAAGQTTLTLTDDTDLANFRVGDTVTEGNNTSVEVVADAVVSGWIGVQTSPENSLVGSADSQTTNPDEINKAMDVPGLQAAVEAAYATGSSSTVATQSVWGGAYNNRLYAYLAGSSGATEDGVLRYKVTKPGTFYLYTGLNGIWNVSSSAVIENISATGGTFSVTTEDAGYYNEVLPDYPVERIKVVADAAAVGSTFDIRPMGSTVYTYYIPVGLIPYGTVGSVSGNTLVLSASSGTWTTDGSTFCQGPDTEPATGVVGSVDPVAFSMTLSTSDQNFPKRWIVGQNKTVIGPPQARYPAGQYPHR